MKHRKTVLIIGPSYPQVGGVATHIDRLKALLESQYEVTLLNPPSPDHTSHRRKLFVALAKILYHLVSKRPDCIHIHTSQFGRALYALPLILALTPKRTARLLTIHGGAFIHRIGSFSSLQKLCLKYSLRRCTHIIAVNPSQKASLDKEIQTSCPISVIPAYIPHSHNTDEKDDPRKPLAELRSGQKLLLTCFGMAIPHYGFHHLAQALSTAHLSKQLHICFVTYSTTDKQYLDTQINLLKKHGYTHTVYLNLSSADAQSILDQTDIFVRPSEIDGDSLAVREAIAKGCIVIASDCVQRPEGVLLFPDRNSNELQKIIESSMTSPGNSNTPINPPNFQKQILDIYASVLER